MKILLKDPTLVDAVIKKITDKYPVYESSFMVYGVPFIKEMLADKHEVVLYVDFYYSQKLNKVVSSMGYDVVTELTTDQYFLNLKEFGV